MAVGDSGFDDTRRPGEPRGGAAVRRRKPTGRAPGEPRNIAWLYLLPGVLFFGLFTLAPLLHSGWLSFFDWDGLTDKRYVGLDNYRTAFSDPDVRAAFGHSAKLVIFYAVVPVVLGLILAGVLTRHPVRGMTFFRTALFLPQTIAGVVVAQAFVWFYALEGPFNRFLTLIGLGSHHARLARRLRLGPDIRRHDRDVGHVRPLHGPVHRRRPEDLDVAL